MHNIKHADAESITEEVEALAKDSTEETTTENIVAENKVLVSEEDDKFIGPILPDKKKIMTDGERKFI